MIADVTDAALIQLLLLADSVQIPQDKVVFKVEGKMRQPVQLMWFITPDTSYDTRYVPTQVKGVNFAVEKNGAIFLTHAILDYDEKLLTDSRVYAPTTTQLDKPVWPKGFVFESQIHVNTLT